MMNKETKAVLERLDLLESRVAVVERACVDHGVLGVAKQAKPQPLGFDRNKTPVFAGDCIAWGDDGVPTDMRGEALGTGLGRVSCALYEDRRVQWWPWSNCYLISRAKPDPAPDKDERQCAICGMVIDNEGLCKCTIRQPAPEPDKAEDKHGCTHCARPMICTFQEDVYLENLKDCPHWVDPKSKDAVERLLDKLRPMVTCPATQKPCEQIGIYASCRVCELYRVAELMGLPVKD